MTMTVHPDYQDVITSLATQSKGVLGEFFKYRYGGREMAELLSAHYLTQVDNMLARESTEVFRAFREICEGFDKTHPIKAKRTVRRKK